MKCNRCTYICLMCEYSCRHLKLHFDTPGAPQSESLSQLAYGMTPAKAARLFYQMSGMYCAYRKCNSVVSRVNKFFGKKVFL
jgi:cohesin complex subunit SCC1